MLHWFCDETYLSGVGINAIKRDKKVIVWSIDQTGVNKRLQELYQELNRDQIECIFSPLESEWGTIRDGILVCKPTSGKDAVLISTMYEWKSVAEQAASLGYEKVYFFMLDEGKEKIDIYRKTFLEVQNINMIPANRPYKYVHFIPDEKFFQMLFVFLERGTNIEDHFFIIYSMYRTPETAVYGTWELYKRVMREHGNIYLLSNIRPMCLDNWDDNKENLDHLLDNSEKIIFHSVHYPRDREIKYLSTKCEQIKKKGILIPWEVAGEHDRIHREYMEKVLQHVRMVVCEVNVKDYFCDNYPAMKDAIFYRSGLNYVLPVSRKFPRNRNRNVLVGHSALPVVMALETMQHIAGIDESFTIYCVAAYGKNKKAIQELGRQLFGDRFVMIERFMEYEEYAEFLSTMDVAVFGMEEMVGRNNLELLLQTGAKVYLKPGLQTWQWACEGGIHVYDYYSIKDESPEQILSNPYESHNAAIVEKRNSMDEKARQWREVVEYNFGDM